MEAKEKKYILILLLSLFISISAIFSQNVDYIAQVLQPWSFQTVDSLDIEGYSKNFNPYKYVYQNYYNYYAQRLEIGSSENINFSNSIIIDKNINLNVYHDEDNNNVILRDPRVIAFYYMPLYYANQKNVFIATNQKEINDLIFYYSSFNSDHKPIIYSMLGIPINFFSYFKLNSTGSVNFPFQFYFSTYNDNIINLIPYNLLDKIPNLPNLLNFINDQNLTFNKTLYDYYVSQTESSLFRIYLNSQNGLAVNKIVFESLPTKTNIEYKGTVGKINVSFISIILPRRGLIIIPTNYTGLNTNNENVTELFNSMKETVNNIFNEFKSKYLAGNTNILIYSANEQENLFNNLNNQINDLKGCIYYYYDYNVDNYKLYTGKLVEEGTLFLPTGDYYYLENNILKKFNKNKVYLCSNKHWIDLENDESACDLLVSLYPIYENISWKNKCLINELEENPIWFRKFDNNKLNTTFDYNLIDSSKENQSYLDCIDENGNIIKNGEISNGLLCSAGVLTPVINNLDKFYIRDMPYNVTFEFKLRNFANESIKLVGYDIKGIPESWKTILKTQGNKIIFDPGEEFTLDLTIFNYEANGKQKNITLILNFELNDNKTNVPIPIKIPFRVQFSKEFLTKSEFKGPIIYNQQEGKTEDITLILDYETFGVLKDIPWCGNNNNNICKEINVSFTLPQGCTVNYIHNKKNANLKPAIIFYCNKNPTENDKIKVCSKTIIKESNEYTTIIKDLCEGYNCSNEAHCVEIPMKSISYKKDFSLTTSYKQVNEKYYLVVKIENIGNSKLKGLTLNLTDKTGNCNILCNNCEVNSNVYTWSNPNLEINVGSQYEKVFELSPTGICEVDVKAIVDDPIVKNTTVVINPYNEIKIQNIVKKDNPSLYPILILIASLLMLIIGILKIREELN